MNERCCLDGTLGVQHQVQDHGLIARQRAPRECRLWVARCGTSQYLGGKEFGHGRGWIGWGFLSVTCGCLIVWLALTLWLWFVGPGG